MIKVNKNGRTMKVSSHKKAIWLEFIPEVGDEVEFYDDYLSTNCFGEITEVKGQSVTAQRIPGYSNDVIFTLRNSGEFIEKGFKFFEGNRKLSLL